jgi:hypothetical protein
MKKAALLRKTIWKKKSLWELVIASIGFFLGLGMFLIAVQVYTDIDAIINRRLAASQTPDYLLISKQPGAAGNGFTEGEMEDLRHQQFVLDMGKVLANDFEVEAEVNIFNQGFRTIIFFEAVPDRFLDVVPRGWKEQGTEDALPIIVSRDFLLLYNFGFAQSRRFPILTEDLLAIVPVVLTVRGNGKSERLAARIAGVSDRLASILIPYDAMETLNERYGSPEGLSPFRLVLSVKDRTDPSIIRYLSEHSYDTSKEKLRLSDAGLAVRTILSIIGIIGIVLILLSFTVFCTTARLIISRASPEISLLVDLGYSKRSIAQSGMAVVLAAFAAITFASAVFVYACIYIERGFLLANGFSGFVFFVHPQVAIAGVLIVLLGIAVNYVSLVLSMGKGARSRAR